jgi:hypothetical protein
MKWSLTFLALIVTFPVFCQIVFVEDLSWERASEQARLENKLIFIQLENSQCQQCRDVASKGFESVSLKGKFEQNFISLRANVDTPQGQLLAQRLRVTERLAALYVDADGNILNKFVGSTSEAFKYEQQADIALGRRNQKPMDQYDKEYGAGERSLQFLKEYIQRRKEISVPTTRLLDEYVDLLPVDSLHRVGVVRFIYRMGPSLDSRAFLTLQKETPREIIRNMYKSGDYQENVAMNQAIITTTFQRAVRNKDEELAIKLSEFISNSYGSDYIKGRNGRHRNMVRYYYAVRDTAAYIKAATNFMNLVHMLVTADSLKKMDEFELKNQTISLPAPNQPLPYHNVIKFAPLSQFFPQELNEHAWHFFEMTDNQEDLKNALRWSRHSIILFDELTKGRNLPTKLGNPSYLDTYAQLLYKLGRREEAIEWQTKALQAQMVTGEPVGSYERTLARMKEGK